MIVDHDDRAPAATEAERGEAGKRAEYVRPRLVRVGNLNDLLAGASGTKGDGGGPPFNTKTG